MYEVFAAPRTLTALNIEDDSAYTPVTVPSKMVAAGDFKFTYGLKINSNFAFTDDSTHVRVVFTLAPQNFGADDTTRFAYDSAGNVVSAAFWAADTTANGAANSTFVLTFSTTYQYRAHDSYAIESAFDATIATAMVVALSTDQTEIYVDMPLSYDLKTQLVAADGDFLILHDSGVMTFERYSNEDDDFPVGASGEYKGVWEPNCYTRDSDLISAASSLAARLALRLVAVAVVSGAIFAMAREHALH